MNYKILGGISAIVILCIFMFFLGYASGLLDNGTLGDDVICFETSNMNCDGHRDSFYDTRRYFDDDFTSYIDYLNYIDDGNYDLYVHCQIDGGAIGGTIEYLNCSKHVSYDDNGDKAVFVEIMRIYDGKGEK